MEAEYKTLKRATTMLELALWRKKINEERHSTTQNLGTKKRNKKMKQDKSSLREQCRINCGADIVIERVLPYLKDRY